MKRGQKVDFFEPIGSAITPAKKKERRNRKSEEEEWRRREKSNGCSLIDFIIMATLAAKK